MEFKVIIEAPELTAALLTLANALQERSAGIVKATTILEKAKEQHEATTKSAPVQTAPAEKPESKPEIPEKELEKGNPPEKPESKKIELTEVRAKLSTLPKEKARELIVKYDTSGSNPPKLSNVPEEKYVELLKEAEGLQ